jgi:hypothetical protein
MFKIAGTSDTVYSWYKNDKLLVERKAIIDGINMFDNDYNSKSVRLSDAGNYKCVVKNTIGSIQFKFNVVVYGKDNFIIKKSLNIFLVNYIIS